MSNASDFVIENGVLTKYVGLGGDVVIPDGVTSIGNSAFLGCKSLTNVTIPNGTLRIDHFAFHSCKNLKTVMIPDSVRDIGTYAFIGCAALSGIMLPSGLESIGEYAFSNCDRLTEIQIPASVIHLTGKSLNGCTVNVAEDNPFFCSINGVLYDKNMTKLIRAPRTVSGTYMIPASVTSIGESAFCECSSLTNVIIPEGVTSIGKSAFYKCKKLSKVNISTGVTSIGIDAFCCCRKLSEVVLPEGVESLGHEAFRDCGKIRISLPSTLKRPPKEMLPFHSWEYAPFYGSTCTFLVDNWSGVLTSMMKNCEIEEIITSNYSLIPGEILLPVAVSMAHKKGWNSDAEAGKALLAALMKKSGKLCSQVTANPAWLQFFCNNRLIKVKDLDAYLEDAEKQNNAEAKAMLLNYQNKLGSKAVEKAREKKEKDKETYFDALAERASNRDPSKGIEGMTFVITGQLNAWPKVWTSRKDVEEYLTRYGAKLGASLTKETDYLVTNDTESGSAKNEKAKKLGVEVITEEEFNQMVGRRFIDAETIHVPAWVKTIELAAFSFPDWESWKKNGYKKLEKVELPEGLSSIGKKAFAGAEKLEKIDIPGSVTSIGDWAFAACSALTEITLPENLRSIGARAFDGCSGLKKILVPEDVTIIEIGAFGNCANLEEVDLPTSVKQIELMAFDGCPKLTIRAQAGSYAAGYARRNGLSFSVIGEESAPAAGGSDDFVIENGVLTQYLGDGGDVAIPSGVKAIAPMAFYGCLSLTGVTIPEGVTNVSFSGCSNLTRITLPNSIKSFEYGAFFNCSSLAELTIPESVTQIGKQAFYNCSSLKKLVIPGSVKELADEVFSNCGALETIVFSEGVEALGKNEFFSCSSLRAVYLPASLKKIGSNNYFFRMTIHAPVKSYAEKYAKRNKIAFVVLEKE